VDPKYFELSGNPNHQVWLPKCFSKGGLCQEKGANTMFKSRLAALTITTVLTSLTAFAQEDYTRFKSEASVQALGSFVKQTIQNGV
jgi:hypothetical protein